MDRREAIEIRENEENERLAAEAPDEAEDRTEPREEERRIPLLEEELDLEKRRTGATIRVRTKVSEREETVDTGIVREAVDVMRVPVDRVVERREGVRVEGDTTIVPLYEEVLVVEKRLLLREELHLTSRRDERQERTTINLRSEHAEIERIEGTGVAESAPERGR